MEVQAGMTEPKRVAAKGEKIEWMDLVRLFERQWRWAGVTFVIATVSAFALLNLIKPQWEAQATVRIGQVYDALVGASRPVEPLQEALARLRARSFIEDALREPGVAPDPSSKDLLLSSAKFESLASTDLFRVTVRSYNSDQAKLFVRAIVDGLSLIHRSLEELTRSETERLEAEYTKELGGLREERSNLEKALSSTIGSGATDVPTLALIAWALNANSREARGLEYRKLLLIRQNESHSYPTTIVGEISSVSTALPSRILVVVFSTVLGLGSGFLVATLRDYFVRRRS